MALGYHVSFAGNVTYPKATKLQAAARDVDVTSMLLETDCPFLAPVPYRGKRNEPSYVKLVAEKIAHARGTTEKTITEETTHNAKNVFQLTDEGF